MLSPEFSPYENCIDIQSKIANQQKRISKIKSELEGEAPASVNRKKLNDLLKDVFPEITDEELKRIKLKELVPFFIDLFVYVTDSFGTEKN